MSENHMSVFHKQKPEFNGIEILPVLSKRNEHKSRIIWNVRFVKRVVNNSCFRGNSQNWSQICSHPNGTMAALGLPTHLSLSCLSFLLLFLSLPCFSAAFTSIPPTLSSFLARRGATPFPRHALEATDAAHPRTSMRSSALIRAAAEPTGGGVTLGTLEQGASLLGRDSFCSYPGALATDSIAALRADCATLYEAGNFWLPATGEVAPRCALERLAADIFAHYTEGAASFNPESSGVEWWVQVRKGGGAGEGIGMHWDKDEVLCAEGGGVVNPAVGTVTYLSDAGAPTLVMNQKATVRSLLYPTPPEPSTLYPAPRTQHPQPHTMEITHSNLSP